MHTIEFYTNIKNGTLQIPREIREALKHTSRVRVILFLEPPPPSTSNLIDHLLAHPLQIPDFHPLPRDAAHAR